jgi:glycosyltransferase involved in cell wall biosynthesis
MSGKIRVLFAIGSMAGGGSERQIAGLLQHLDRARFTPMLYLVYRDGPLLSEVPEDVPVFAFWDRHTSPRWNYPGRILRLQSRDMADVLREQQVDLVYDRTFHMTMIASPASRRCHIPRISVAVADPQLALEHNEPRFTRLKQRRLRNDYRTADRVVAVSEGVRSALIQYYALPPHRVTTIYNMIDVERIERLADEPGDEFEPGRFHIVSAGRLQPQKGYGVLLRALDDVINTRGHKQVTAHIFGRGELRDELKREVAAKGLQDHVCFKGFQPNPLPAVRKADLFCLPSLYEGMPNALIEAMALQVPVLATNCPSGPAEVLQNGKYGELVEPNNAKSLADAIENVLQNGDRWQSRVEPAREWVLETFSPVASVAKVAALIEEIHHSRRQ